MSSICCSVKECEMKHQGIKKIKPSQLVPWRNREAKFVCDTCGYRTKGKASLDRHIKGKHSSERPFQCKECGKDFKSRASLESHGSVHGKLKSTNIKKPMPSVPETSIISRELPDSNTSKFESLERSVQFQQPMHLPSQPAKPTTAFFWLPHTNPTPTPTAQL